MAWYDDLQAASFRDVPFHVDTIEHHAGDNVVLREYPFQDLPTIFRMGEGAEDIKFTGYVIGEDYTQKRDALRQVLSGEGVLVHPTAGRLRVYVAGKFTIKENPTAEGGMARFDLHFVRADARSYPLGVTNTPQEAFNKAEKAKQASRDAFAAQWRIDDAPGWVAERAVARVEASLDVLWPRLAAATQGLGDFTSQIVGNYQALRTGLNDLVRTPRVLADAVATLFELPAELTQAATRDFKSAFEWVFDLDKRLFKTGFEAIIMPPVGMGLVMYGAGTPPVLAQGGLAQVAALQTQSDQLVELLATAAHAQTCAALDLANYDDALALRALVHAQMTRLLLRASSAPAPDALPGSSVHDALLALHGATLADLQARSLDLARLTSFTPTAWMPVEYISYHLFGTAAYADEVMAMNPHITHPLLVPPGVALRIVRHD